MHAFIYYTTIKTYSSILGMFYEQRAESTLQPVNAENNQLVVHLAVIVELLDVAMA